MDFLRNTVLEPNGRMYGRSILVPFWLINIYFRCIINKSMSVGYKYASALHVVQTYHGVVTKHSVTAYWNIAS